MRLCQLDRSYLQDPDYVDLDECSEFDNSTSLLTHMPDSLEPSQDMSNNRLAMDLLTRAGRFLARTATRSNRFGFSFSKKN